MTTNLHLTFPGTCTKAFDFYEDVFGTKRVMTMTYGDAPAGSPTPPEMKDMVMHNMVMHTSMPLGGIILMGCDSPAHYTKPMGGFQVAVNLDEADEVKRVFEKLADGGSVQMPLAPTFWSPLFGMATDKFGVAWMVGIPGPQQ